MMTSLKLTVLFNEPFWIGVFEKVENKEYTVCKVTFGEEPKDEEVLELIKSRFYKLKFSNPTKIETSKDSFKKINPKKLQRKIKEETESKGIGTKAQLAMKLQYEENKTERKKKSKEEKEKEAQRKFQLRQDKKMKKHKGH
jgi:hypothetical protein